MNRRGCSSASGYVLTLFALVATDARAASAAADEPRLEIISVKPNKIVYAGGEPGHATVRLVNPLAQPQRVTLRSTLKWDIEDSRALEPVQTNVPATGEATARVAWPKVTSKWGHEIRVEAHVAGRVVDVARQFFGVNTDWMDLMLIAYHPPRHGGEWPFVTYSTVRHWHCPFPGTYVDQAPKLDWWHSGHVGWKRTKKQIQEGNKRCQAVGMHCTFYNCAFSRGAAGAEWARRHPEWIVHNRHGRPALEGSALALAKPVTDPAHGHVGIQKPAFYDPKCIEWGARNALESIKMFGWDGMFWDCGGVSLFPGYTYDGQPTPHGQDPDRISARNFRLFREIIRKQHPHFAFWYNSEARQIRQPFWSRFGNNGGPAALAEQMSVPQSAMLVEHRFHEKPGSRFNNWRRCYDTYAEERDICTQPFGAPVLAGYTWGWRHGKRDRASRYYWVASNHLSALYLATQMHTMTNPNPGLWPGTQFMTRYSALLWRRDVKVIADPQRIVTVEPTRPVWWKKSVYRRPTSEGEDVLVHLVSVPETETVDIYRVQDPPPARATVALKLPAGKRLRSVWALQTRGYVDDSSRGGAPWKVERRNVDGKPQWVHTGGSICRFGPTQGKLDAKAAGDRVSVSVPAFMFHTLVVFRLEG